MEAIFIKISQWILGASAIVVGVWLIIRLWKLYMDSWDNSSGMEWVAQSFFGLPMIFFFIFALIIAVGQILREGLSDLRVWFQ